MSEYEVTVKVKVDVEDYNNVNVNRDNVVKAVVDALESYKKQMGDAITATGNWNDDCEVIGSNWACEVK